MSQELESWQQAGFESQQEQDNYLNPEQYIYEQKQLNNNITLIGYDGGYAFHRDKQGNIFIQKR